MMKFELQLKNTSRELALRAECTNTLVWLILRTSIVLFLFPLVLLKQTRISQILRPKENITWNCIESIYYPN